MSGHECSPYSDCGKRIAALERELAQERERADGNYASYERVKEKYSAEVGVCRPNTTNLSVWCRRLEQERDEAHAAIRWLMARFHPYVNVPIEHAPAIRRVRSQ